MTPHGVRLWVSSPSLLRRQPGFAQSDQQSPGPPPSPPLRDRRPGVHRSRGPRGRGAPDLPLLAGDRLRTDEGGSRSSSPTGQLLHVDRATTVDVLAADLLRLLQGRVFVYRARGPRTRSARSATRLTRRSPRSRPAAPASSAWRPNAGRQVELAVFSGQATLANNGAEVRAGEQSFVRDGLAPSAPCTSIRPAGTISVPGARRGATIASAPSPCSTCHRNCGVCEHVRPGTAPGAPIRRGRRLVPAVQAGWRPYSVGFWSTYPPGFVLDWRRPVGMADASLRTLGLLVQFRLVLETRPAWGPAWVSWASRSGLRELVPARPAWLSGVRPLRRARPPTTAITSIRGAGGRCLPRHAYGRPLSVGRYAGRRAPPRTAASRGAFVAHREPPRIDVAVPRAGAGVAASARLRNGQPGGPGGGFRRARHRRAAARQSRGFGLGERRPRRHGVAPIPAQRRAGPGRPRDVRTAASPHRGVSCLARSPQTGSRSSFPDRGRSRPFRATPRSVQPGQSPREALGGGENAAPMDRATRRFPVESPGASGMPGASRRFPAGGDTGRQRCNGRVRDARAPPRRFPSRIARRFGDVRARRGSVPSRVCLARPGAPGTSRRVPGDWRLLV